MSELRKTLINHYPEEEADRIISDLSKLPEKTRKIEEDRINVFFKKYGEEIPPII